jgi:hypothetical protein
MEVTYLWPPLAEGRYHAQVLAVPPAYLHGCVAAGRAIPFREWAQQPPPKVKFTGLTQNLQADPAVWLKIPIRALGSTQIMGQPCEFQVPVGGALCRPCAFLDPVRDPSLLRVPVAGCCARPKTRRWLPQPWAVKLFSCRPVYITSDSEYKANRTV